jgi:beta-galactosidase
MKKEKITYDGNYYYGSAYYPELWPIEEIPKDLKYMKELGFNLARMGEFAWSFMEPTENNIDISFFADVIKKLHKNGISTVFCTPTATPPVWISHNHPERMFVKSDGTRMGHGSRQQLCTNNPEFRKRVRIIVKEIAKTISDLPGLVAWQTDNELKGHVQECCCETCNHLWHEWLEVRYKTIENLNDAWGTDVWSHRYHSFEQVVQPLPAPFLHSASLSTAYRMFSHDKIVEFQDEQIAIIRKYSNAPITHNSNLNHYLNNETLYKNLYFAAFDDYPSCEDSHQMLMNYDLWRTIKKDTPFWVMETGTSHNGCLLGYSRLHKKGYIIAEAMAAYAMGGTGFSYWLFRQPQSGAELPHSSLISSYGKPTIGFNDAAEIGKLLKQITPILSDSKPISAEVAITYSDRARAYFITEPLEGIEYRWEMLEFYKNILDTGIHRDVIHESAELDNYKILMTPMMPYMSKEYLERAKRFVKNGGVWIVGPITGTRTVDHTTKIDAELGKDFEDFAGIETAFGYSPSKSEEIGHAFGLTFPLSLWSQFFNLKGAKAIGTVSDGREHGLPFLTEHSVGKGKVVTMGSMPAGEQGAEMIKKMVKHYAHETSIKTKYNITPGTIAIPRSSQNGELLFVVNMNGEGGEITLNRHSEDVLTGDIHSGSKINLNTYEFKVLKL